RQYRSAMLVLGCAALLPAGICWLQVMDSEPEGRLVLARGQKASKIIEVQWAAAIKPSAALLLLDGDSRLANAQIVVNGRLLPSPVPVQVFFPQAYQIVGPERESAGAVDRAQSDVRQWRAAVVPLDILN